METIESPRSPFLHGWLLWTAGFVALPLAGFAGSAIVGRVDDAMSALIGGAIVGLIIGLGQALTSTHRLQAVTWIPATTIGMSVGLFLGATAVSYRTSLADLILMGAINGLVLGAAQTIALPRRAPRRWIWAAAMPVLWALGWSVSTLILVGVDKQFIVFGASGALVVTALSGLLLHSLLPYRQKAGTYPALPGKAATA